MRIQVHQTVDGDLLEEAWKVYLTAFDDLRRTAVQRHVLHAHEFDEIMRDGRVQKYLAYEGDRVVAVATFTNDLLTMPLVSPEYFAHRWPEAYAEGRIWYIGFTAVHPHAHGTGAFASIVSLMTQTVSAVDGVAVVDICRRNDEVFRFPSAIARLIRSHAPHMRDHNLDAQTYFAYDFARSA